MKYILIALLLLSCAKNKPVKSKASLEDLHAKRDLYVELIKDPYALVERCDGLTFIGLFDAYGRRVDIYAHEYEPGQWHRDVEPCYPDDSRSEISTEGILGALHAMTRRGDHDKIQALWDYLEDNNWTAGLGPTKYTNVIQLRGLIKGLLEKSWGIRKTNYEALITAEFMPGYKGNVLADYVALHHLALGHLKDWHVAAIGQLVSEVPQSPLYNALAGCYDSQEHYQATLNILGDDELFPADRLPERSNEGLWDWSDGPQVPMFDLTVAILESCSYE